MENKNYENHLAKKLIEDFQQEFYEKIGYVPIIYNLKKEKQQIIRLDLLELIINKYIPKDIIIKHKVHSIKNKCRFYPLCDLRHIFCYIAYSMEYNLNTIGKYLNGRDHTTVLSSIKKFKLYIKHDLDFLDQYKDIQDDINEYFKDNGDKLLQFAIENPVDS